MPKLQPSLGIAGFFLTTLLTPLPAIAALFSQTYVFGDSLSDIGRLYGFTGNQIPVSPPYAQKLSNGPLWIEYLQGYLGIPVNPATNFALAGATTGSANTTLPQPLGIGIEQQVTGFLTNFPVDPQALYVLWGGANDYLGGGVTDPSIPVTNLSNHINSLYSAGARNFFVPNIADLGQLPLTLPPNPNSPALSQLSIAHATLLQTSLQNLSNTLPSSKIIYFDAFSVIGDITNNPSNYQITNVTEACLPTNPLGVPAGLPCTNPQEYLFWDAIHPSTRTHEIVAQAAARRLGIPEPASSIAVLSLGAIAIATRLGKKRAEEKGFVRLNKRI